MRIDWREALDAALYEAGHTQVEAAAEIAQLCGEPEINAETVGRWVRHRTRTPARKFEGGIEQYIRRHGDEDFDIREAINAT